MRQSVRLGRVAGIDIGAHWSVLVVVVLLGYVLSVNVLPAGAPGYSGTAYVLVAIAVSVIFLGCLLAHELAHALVARRNRVGARRITLWLLGGVSELDSDPPTPRAEFLIAAVGPFVSLVLGAAAGAGAVLLGAVGVGQLVVVALAWLALVNVLLGVFNLLPGAPLDGGRIVRAVVWRLRGDRDRAQVAASRAGVAVAVLLGLVGAWQLLLRANLSGLWLILIALFMASAAKAETAGLQLHRALDGRSVRDIMEPEPVYGQEHQTVDAFVTDTATRHPRDSYPVVDEQHRPVGLVRLSDLARIPPPERPRMPLLSAATRVVELPAVAADDPATTAARNLSPATPVLAVTDHDRLVGVVTPSDIERAVELAMLGRTDRPGPSAAAG